MKVGTDGVLLGAWMPIRVADRRLLDIGTGTGLIALMAAQRSPKSRITAIELDEAAAEQAQENVAHSPWGERIEVHNTPLQAYHAEEPFDLIFSNPPYFEDALPALDQQRTYARHTTTLPFKELLQGALRLLAPEGRFALILPTEQADRFVRLAALDLWLERRCDVATTPSRPPRRSLLLFSKVKPERVERERLVIQHSPEAYTEEYIRLLKEFYLKF